MTQTELQATSRTAGSLVQSIFDVLARTMAHMAATERSSPERRSNGSLSAEILRDTGASHAYQDYSDDREVRSAKRLFNIADSVRMALPRR